MTTIRRGRLTRRNCWIIMGVMLHIVSFSTGLSSAICVERVYERYGANAMQVIFMDTTCEDSDNYRFMKEMYSRWHDVGIEIVNLKEGRGPYEVAKDEHIIPNNKLAPCTFRLKIEPFVKHLESIDGDITIHIGYDYSEVHRCEATRNNYESRGWNVDFPLLWKPYELRPYTQVCRDDWDIEPPRMYGMGYSHANCGGICVKQGQGDWIKTLINFPDRYAMVEMWEQAMRDHPKRKNYALLRDRSNGMTRPKTLTELREEYQNKPQLGLFDQVSCIHCGVSDFVI